MTDDAYTPPPGNILNMTVDALRAWDTGAATIPVHLDLPRDLYARVAELAAVSDISVEEWVARAVAVKRNG